MQKTGAVVTAAGLSSRMGEFKPLLPFGDMTIAEHVVSLLRQASADPIVMVTGYRADELEARLAGSGVRFVRNDNYRETEMFDSVCLGILSIADECERILFLPVDTPAIQQKTIRQVMMIDADLVRTMYGGRGGHPVLMRSRIAKKLCEYKGDEGLRGAIRNSGISVTNLVVDDKGVILDIDTQEQYQKMEIKKKRRSNQ